MERNDKGFQHQLFLPSSQTLGRLGAPFLPSFTYFGINGGTIPTPPLGEQEPPKHDLSYPLTFKAVIKLATISL